MRTVREQVRRILLPFMCAVFLCSSVFGTNALSVYAESYVIKSVLMTYGEEQFDVYNGITTISNEYDEILSFDFELENPSKISTVIFYSEQEDGTRNEMWRKQGSHLTHAEMNLYDLLPEGGIRMVVMRNGQKCDDIMLGVLVEEGKNRRNFGTSQEWGPSKGITVDLSSLADNMSFSMNLIPIPVVYKKYPDGRHVIGLGWNAKNQKFWDDARQGNFSQLSSANLKEIMSSQDGTMKGKPLGLVWAISGYATSFDDNPEKLTGTLQFYAGTGANFPGQYLIFTYSIKVTIGVGGELTFVLSPGREDGRDLPIMAEPGPQPEHKSVMDAELDLSPEAGIEMFGGIGAGNYLSAGIYGSGTFHADMHVTPGFYMKAVYVDGEIGLRAKFMGLTVLSFTLFKDRQDFYKRQEDGTEVYSTEISVKAAYDRRIEELMAEDYGAMPYEIDEPEGDMVWLGGNNLTALAQPAFALNEESIPNGDAPYARKIAENVHPDAGVQVVRLKDKTRALIGLVANNPNRPFGNKGELRWMLYDNADKSISEPMPAVQDIDHNGAPDSGRDYDPRMKLDPLTGEVYAVWKRAEDGMYAKNPTLREAAGNVRLCFAVFDPEEMVWKEEAIVLDDPDQIIADAAIGFDYPNPNDPSIFVIMNPAEDPAGLSPYSVHRMYEYRRDAQGNWKGKYILSASGRISSFDAGYYYFADTESGKTVRSAVWTTEDADGHSRVRVFGSEKTNAQFFAEEEGAKAQSIEEPLRELKEERSEKEEPIAESFEKETEKKEAEEEKQTEEPAQTEEKTEELSDTPQLIREEESEGESAAFGQGTEEETIIEEEPSEPSAPEAMQEQPSGEVISKEAPVEKETDASAEEETEPKTRMESEEEPAETEEEDAGTSVAEEIPEENGRMDYRVEFDNARNGAFAMNDGILALTFTEDQALYFATGYRNNYKYRVFPLDEKQGIPEASPQLIGDLVGNSMIGYLTSVNGSQNIKGYVRSEQTADWHRAEMTDVAQSANVSYFGGTYFRNGEPMIIYTVQNYSVDEDISNERKFIDGTTDLYIQAGEVNAHVSAVNAEVMNLEELGGDDTPASVSLEVENNGIEPIDTIAVYAKRIGSDEEYAFIGSFDVSTLYPGQTKELVFDLSEEFRDPSRFSIGVTGSSQSYAREDLQSLTILDVPEGTLKISDSDYSYRRLDHDRYAVTVTSAGPGKKSGTLVIHDPKTGEIVKEVRIENLAPSETTEIVICDEEGVLSESHAKLGAYLIRGEETAETRTAQADDTETFLMPWWFGSSLPVEEIKPAPLDDRKTGSSSEKEESDHPVTSVPSFRISGSNEGKRTVVVNTSDQNHVMGHGFVLIISLIAAAVSRKMLKDQNE